MGRRPTLVDPGESPVHAFARLIIDRRRELKISREQLAQQVNFGATYVGEVERGQRLPSLETALAMATVLGLDVEAVRGAWEMAAGSPAGADLEAGSDPTGPLVRDDDEPMPEPTEAPSASTDGRSTRYLIVGGTGLAIVAAAAIIYGAFRPTPRETVTPPLRPTTAPIVTTTTTAPPASYRDDFNGARSWPQNSEPLFRNAYLDGQYQMTVSDHDSEYFVKAPSQLAWTNVRVEADVVQATGSAVFGVSCAMATGSSPAHYVGVISNTGFWRISRYEGAPDATPRNVAQATGPASAIRGDAANRVSLDCSGSGAAHSPVTLTLAVNGVQLGAGTDVDGLAAGRVGLSVSAFADPIDVRFDNFAATEIRTTSSTTSPAPTAPRPTSTTAAPASGLPALSAQLTEVYDFPGAPDKGSLTMTLNDSKGEICYELKLRETDKPTETHLHEGTPGRPSGTSIALEPRNGTPGQTSGGPGAGRGGYSIGTGCQPVAGDLMARLLAGPDSFYVEVHTSQAPQGAVRGQLGR